MKNDIEKSIDFVLELEKLKAVTRRVKPVGLDRYENSAEHSWQVALLALVLSGHSNSEIDVAKVVKMMIVHDIGEIDADDVFFFNESGRADAKERELAGVKRIFALLPEQKSAELFELWNEFENGDSPEAKFARAIDRAMPVLQNIHNNRQSWEENGVTKEQILTKTAYIGDGSAALWETLAVKIEAAFDEK